MNIHFFIYGCSHQLIVIAYYQSFRPQLQICPQQLHLLLTLHYHYNFFIPSHSSIMSHTIENGGGDFLKIKFSRMFLFGSVSCCVDVFEPTDGSPGQSEDIHRVAHWNRFCFLLQESQLFGRWRGWEKLNPGECPAFLLRGLRTDIRGYVRGYAPLMCWDIKNIFLHHRTFPAIACVSLICASDNKMKQQTFSISIL